MKKSIIYSILVFSILLIDRLSKILITEKVKNYGAAFGILQGHTTLFVIVAALLIILIGYYIWKIKSELLRVSLSLILAGTIGNLIDRMFFGYVIDVISLGLIPAFNIADLSNTIGAVLLIIFILRKDKLY